MKNLVVLYYMDDWFKDVPMNSDLTRKAFESWHGLGAQKNIAVYRASIQWFDEDKGVFTKAWAFRDGKWQKIEKEIKPDLIYDKVSSKRDYELFDLKSRIIQKIKMLNDPQFRAITGNKLSQYMLFKEFMPKSFIANDFKELKKAVRKIKTDKVVIKPIYGSGGNGIVIDEKEKALKEEFYFPVLVQEFILSQKGIPGFSTKDEVSDLRLVYNNHKLIYALSRIAKDGSLFTNLHQGATACLVPKEKIPAVVQKMVKKIQKRLSVFPAAQYSLDFIFNNDAKPYLVELNTTPGMDLIHVLGDEKIFEENFNTLVDKI